MTTIVNTPTADTLRAAVRDLHRAEAALSVLGETITRHEQAAPTPPADLEALRAEVADLAAAVALGEAPEAELIEARARLAAAVQAERSQRSAQEQHAEVLAGLKRRRQRAEAARDDALERQKAAEKACLLAAFENADAEYVAAALALGRAWRRAEALRNATELFRFRLSRPPLLFPMPGGPASAAAEVCGDPGISIVSAGTKDEDDELAREIAALKALPSAEAKPGILARARRAIGGAA